jgi:iron complex outermembrane recepter protein
MLKTLLTVSVALGALSYGASPVLAQSVAPATEVVIVTAQKREQSLQDVPIAITVVSGAELSTANLNSATELRFIVPSIQFSDSANLRGEGFAIRGVGTNTFADGVEQAVGVAIDGVVLGRSGMGAADLLDISRVEVLRGPQGMLFGKNASAGLISITTNKPTQNLQGSLRASYATENEIKLEGVFNAPLGDKAAFRIAAGQTMRDGYILNVANGQKLNDRNEWGARAKLSLTPTDKFTFMLSADYTNRDALCCAWTVRAIGPTSPLPFFLGTSIKAGPENESTNVRGAFVQATEGYGLSAEMNWQLNNVNLTSLTAYRKWEQSDNNDPDLTPLNILDINSGGNDLEMFSQEVRMASLAASKIEWTVGVFFSSQSLANTSTQAGTLGAALPPGVLIGRQLTTQLDNTSLALFGQATWNATDKLQLVAGGRATKDKVELDYTRRTPAIAAIQWPGLPPLAFAGQTNADNVSWRVGAQYDVTPEIMAYVTASRGYKGPGVNTLLDQRTPIVSAVAPEIPTSFEVGFKSTLLDRRLILNAVAFKTTFKDFQAEVFDLTVNPVAARVRNAGELETQGVEIETQFRPTAGLRFGLNASWIDASFTDFKNIPCYVGQPVLAVGTARTTPRQCITLASGVSTTNGDGNRLTNAPEFAMNVTAGYGRQIGSYSLSFNANYAWRGDVSFSAAGDPGQVQAGYGLLGASIGIRPSNDRWELRVFGRNLADQKFVSRVIPDLLFPAAGSYAQFTTFESRRIIGVSLSAKFGQ